MSQGSEAADQMVKESIQLSEAAVKLTALGAKNLAALCLALANENQKLAGKTKMSSLLKSGKELKVFDIKENDLTRFSTSAKQYGVLFSAIKHSKDENGCIDILVKAEDVSKINRIMEKMDYHLPSSKEETKKAAPRVLSENKYKEHGTGSTKEDTMNNRKSVIEKINEYKELLKNQKQNKEKEWGER